ncbi:MAG TPA: hypothetical protein VLA09_07590 [Longimicrobiales bacterium]|nr:hypothetical protein [Longimicrobiales bacterium]
MKTLFGVLAALTVAQAASAQAPGNYEALELERSRTCVDILARLADLDERLAPLADRSQRLLAIAQAVALEDADVVDSLDATDPVEAAVRDWFAEDAGLANRYLAEPSPTLEEERAAGREAIKNTVTEAVEAVQAEAQVMIDGAGDLGQRAGSCTGAVFVRSAVLEACATAASPVCDAARDSTTQRDDFRFVESAEVLWGLQELRAWTAPGPISVTPDGQLGGAQTVGGTRAGNVIVTVAFAPWLQEREGLSPEAAEQVQTLAESIGFGDAHPRVVFVPALSIRATLPEPLDQESEYLFHFGPPEEAEVFWAASAGTGTNVEALVPLAPGLLARLQAGDQMTLTAVRAAEDGETDALFAIELTSLNQGPAVSALLSYMANQLDGDLAQLIPPAEG